MSIQRWQNQSHIFGLSIDQMDHYPTVGRIDTIGIAIKMYRFTRRPKRRVADGRKKVVTQFSCVHKGKVKRVAARQTLTLISLRAALLYWHNLAWFENNANLHKNFRTCPKKQAPIVPVQTTVGYIRSKQLIHMEALPANNCWLYSY